MTTSPPDRAPLEYAPLAEERLEIVRNAADAARGDAGGIVIRIPPPDVVLHALRITLWSLGLACLGTNAALRMLNVRPRGVTTVFVMHASFLPLPVAALLALLCAYMVVRIARCGRRRSAIAVDDAGIFIDHPTRIVPGLRHVPFERFAAIEKMEAWPHQLRVVLRDGTPTIVHTREGDAMIVMQAVDEAVRRLRPPHPGPPPPPERGRSIGWTRVPDTRILRDDALYGRVDAYADGVRCTVAPARGWIVLHCVGAAVVLWVAVVLISFVHPVETFTFLQWTAAYAIMMFALFAHQPPSQRGLHPADVVIDVVGDALILYDADYHGRHHRWPRDQIAAVLIGGPMWWLARGGRLTLRLRDGTSVTLLHAQPLCVLRPIARELRRALRLSNRAWTPPPPPPPRRAGG